MARKSLPVLAYGLNELMFRVEIKSCFRKLLRAWIERHASEHSLAWYDGRCRSIALLGNTLGSPRAESKGELR